MFSSPNRLAMGVHARSSRLRFLHSPSDQQSVNSCVNQDKRSDPNKNTTQKRSVDISPVINTLTSKFEHTKSSLQSSLHQDTISDRKPPYTADIENLDIEPSQSSNIGQNTNRTDVCGDNTPPNFDIVPFDFLTFTTIFNKLKSPTQEREFASLAFNQEGFAKNADERKKIQTFLQTTQVMRNQTNEDRKLLHQKYQENDRLSQFKDTYNSPWFQTSVLMEEERVQGKRSWSVMAAGAVGTDNFVLCARNNYFDTFPILFAWTPDNNNVWFPSQPSLSEWLTPFKWRLEFSKIENQTVWKFEFVNHNDEIILHRSLNRGSSFSMRLTQKTNYTILEADTKHFYTQFIDTRMV